MYKQLKKYNFETTQFDSLADAVLRLSDNSTIPFARTLPAYEEYLLWLAEGNTPLPADE
jgi:hypothetical protein